MIGIVNAISSSPYRSQPMSVPSTISTEEVLAASIPFSTPVRGIYFLLQGEVVVYVGQSQDCRKRIYQHTDKEFDAYAIFACDAPDLDAIETAHIIAHRPMYNRRIELTSGYIGVTQVKRLGVMKPQLKRWIKQGIVTPVYLNGAAYFLESELLSALKEGNL